MKEMNNFSAGRIDKVFWLLLAFGAVNLFSIEIDFIENPKPTHVEANYKKLLLVKTISADFDEEYFLANPTSIALDDENSIFIFDRKLQIIFKFSKDFKFIKTFGQSGNGPAEYDGTPLAHKQLYWSKGGNLLYFSDPRHKKIIAYNKNGKFVKEVPIPKYMPRLYPVFKKDGTYFLPSEDGAVDVYSRDGKKTATLLSGKEYHRFICMRPFTIWTGDAVRSNSINTYYDVLPGNRFIVYLNNSSTVYVFQNNTLVKKFDLWPRSALAGTRESIAFNKKISKDNDWLIYLFNRLLVDNDDKRFFYLDRSRCSKEGHKLLYRFNLEGELVNVLYIDKQLFGKQIFVKQNNYFFGFTMDGDIKILKEDKL